MIGRNRELHFLEKVWASRDAFLMVSGRECVGKSSLIRSFSDNKNALYFSAQNASDTLNRIFFEDLIEEQYGFAGKNKKEPSSWKEMFKYFSELSGTDRKILVLDNFEYLLKGNNDFTKVLKSLWENYLQPNFVMLIIIVPTGHYLFELRSNKAFYSKITFHMNLLPVTFPDMMKEMPHHDFDQVMMLYSVAGGVPKYWNNFSDCVDENDFLEAIEHTYLNINSSLFDEPFVLFNNEFRNPEIVHSILYSIACGYDVLQQIELITGYKLSDIYKSIRLLKSLGYIDEKETLIGKKSGLNKAPAFIITDPMLLFWYRFVYPNYNDIKFGNLKAIKNTLKDHFCDHIQNCFKQVLPQIYKKACQRQTIPLSDELIGIFYDAKTEIDLISVDHKQKAVFFGDCAYKSSAYALNDFEAFVDRCQSINPKVMKPFKDYKLLFGVFSNHPFERDLLDYALGKENLLLFNGITMYSIIE